MTQPPPFIPAIPSVPEPAVPAVPSNPDPVNPPPMIPVDPKPITPEPTEPLFPPVPPPTQPIVIPPPTQPVVIPPVPPQTEPPVPPPTEPLIPPPPQTTVPIAAGTTVAPLPQLPEGQMYGAFGQICSVPLALAQCQSISDYAVGPELIKCEKNYDCCLCSVVQCTDCSILSVGNSGLYGVEAVLIDGRDVAAGGADILCKGTESCTNSVMQASNIHAVDCSGIMGCQGATITIWNPTNNFYLDCTGMASCQNLKIHFVLSAPEVEPCSEAAALELLRGQISCIGAESCVGMELTMTNNGCGKMEIEHFECQRNNACSGASFDLIGAVDIGTCSCGESCKTMTGIESCYDYLEGLFCEQPNTCSHTARTITNPMDGFIFKCSARDACAGATFTVHLDEFAKNVRRIDGILCSAHQACNGTTFIFENKQPEGIQVEIEKLECGPAGSCEDTTIVLGPNVNLKHITCGPQGCIGCMIQRDINIVGVPCDIAQIRPSSNGPAIAAVHSIRA